MQMLHKLKNNPLSTTFLHPIDSSSLIDYDSIIQKKMSLSEIDTNLIEHKIKSIDEFKHNVVLVFDNCIKYWTRRSREEKREPDTDIYVCIASTLKEKFLRSFAKLPLTRENDWLITATRTVQKLCKVREDFVRELTAKMSATN